MDSIIDSIKEAELEGSRIRKEAVQQSKDAKASAKEAALAEKEQALAALRKDLKEKTDAAEAEAASAAEEIRRGRLAEAEESCANARGNMENAVHHILGRVVS